eukprot:5948584-Alexandrium_andersonii.AAC.1
MCIRDRSRPRRATALAQPWEVGGRPLLNIGDHRFSDFRYLKVRRAKVHVHLAGGRPTRSS